MRLKRLEIKGFKSFADETVLHFEESVIGVVGPNGSGKSNVVDAIRWVLGEQKSRELRLEKMSDVIFNGTRKRKESSMAQVTLVFDNDKGVLPSDYQQISVSRLLYRSGESEYRLNNVPCRLKDIQSLFIDTGIGSNSYAIIALGMVDDLLADKENARRTMFEQAAGISKYKTRKKETLSKLKSTSDDLNRIEDLLFEIEGNLKSLESQARRAQKYLDIKKSYKETSVQYAIKATDNLKKAYKTKEIELQTAQDAWRKHDAELHIKEAEVQKLKSKHIDDELALTNQQKQLSQLTSNIRTQENEKALALQKQTFHKEQLGSLTKAIEKSKELITKYQQEVERRTTRIQEALTLQQSISESKKTKEANYNSLKQKYQEAKKLSDQLARTLQKLDQDLFNTEKQLAVAQNKHENLRHQVTQIEQQTTDRSEQVENLLTEAEELQKQVNHSQKSLDLAIEKQEQRSHDIAQIRLQLQEAKDQHTEVARKLDAYANEYQLVKSMVDSFEGFPESIKYLSTKWRSDIPILSDILDVDDRYRQVIEQYLEPYLNHFLVDNVSVATEAIRLLSNSQLGKAHFFLLDRIPVIDNTDAMIANAYPVHQLVKVSDEKFLPLLRYLLADTYLFEGSMEDFKYLDTYREYNFLSAHGTFIKTKVGLHGGSVGLFEGKKIGRKQQLDKLAKKVKTFESQRLDKLRAIESTELKLQDLLNIQSDQKIPQLRQQTASLQTDLTKIQTRLQEHHNYVEQQQNRIQQLTAERATVETHMSQLEASVKDLREQRKRYDNRDSNEELNMEDLAKSLESATESFNQANIELIKHQNLISNLEKDQTYALEVLKENTTQLSSDQAKRENTIKAIEDLTDSIQKQDADLQKMYADRSTFDKALGEAEKAYLSIRNHIQTEEDTLRKMQRHLNTLQSEAQTINDAFTGIKFQINAVGDRLKIEFGISINEIINETSDSDSTESDLLVQVEKLKNRLSNFGEVNPMAVEAYQEMKVRYDNIQAERNDILEAKESLLETIKEIEHTATTNFLEAFDQVRNHFIKVFRSLFTQEDTCDLILLNPDEPLESNIEIIAKPKGKKPVSLSQLSGGEKTLTATALLFALYLLKPAPFCIFDEVDAPLDDANIQKFNKIIKTFSNESQFIIVTHNKATMAAVDILYGVYMQEQGVSGVSAVDFRDYADDMQTQQVNE